MLKVECKVDFSWEANQYRIGEIYEIPNTDQYKRFVGVGYFRLIDNVQKFPDKETLEVKELKKAKETKELKSKRKTK